MEKNEEYKTSNYDDVKKVQDAILKNSSQFEKLGLDKLVGCKSKIHEETQRLKSVLSEFGIAQCNACNQEIKQIVEVPNIDVDKTCFKEAQRIKKNAKKGTQCRACGSEAKLITHTLDLNKVISLVEIVKFFRHHPDAKQELYYTSKDYFAGLTDEYADLFNTWDELYLWDLTARMPTHPTKVIYKNGYYGITENGIKFVQREIGVPKTAYSYNGEIDSYESDFVTIDKILEDANLEYDELIKV